jgi:hypothetical protein
MSWRIQPPAIFLIDCDVALLLHFGILSLMCNAGRADRQLTVLLVVGAFDFFPAVMPITLMSPEGGAQRRAAGAPEAQQSGVEGKLKKMIARPRRRECEVRDG